jgi:alkaline phosphatase D
MTLLIDRRRLVLAGTLGLGACAIPGFALAHGGGFTHSVASGEPRQDSVLLWTRYEPTGTDTAQLIAEISEQADFHRIVASQQVTTGFWRDFTAKVTLTGLKPGTRYFYRFVTPQGERSPTGRTRTLPDSASRFTIGIFSCSNLGFGYFNAYAHAAARDDIDLALHVGDYIYEYPHGTYPALADTIAQRLPQPTTECFHLADYRLRYASYRSDPDLQAIHAAKPMLIQGDDHESANNSWYGGAQNHGKDEGDWHARKAAAIQAWHEWMPVSDAPWASYDIGGLATLFRTEGRFRRSPPPDVGSRFFTADPTAALIAFRDGAWQDPAATMLGSEQEAWLSAALAASVRSGRRWQVTAFGTVMGKTRLAEEQAGWIRPTLSALGQASLKASVAAGKLGLPADFDNWGGYPAARARFLKAAQSANANLLLVAGDSHNGWAYDLARDGKPAGVEFAGQSVSSSGAETAYDVDPKALAAALVARNPELKWCDMRNRGYMALTLTPERATNDWVFVDTVRERNPAAKVGHTATVQRGRNVMA